MIFKNKADNPIDSVFRHYLSSFRMQILSVLVSPSYNMAQKRGIYNLLCNFSSAALRKRSLARNKYGFAPDGYVIGITNRCNLACKYCFAESGSKTPIDIDFAKLKIIIDEMSKLFGIRFITITGGEPFPLIIKIAKMYPHITFNCYTNGSYLDAEMCKELKKLGNVICSLSIIGGMNVNDAVRGKTNYTKVMNAINNLKAKSLIWGFSLTESKANLKDLLDNNLLEELAGLNPYFFRMIPYMPVGRGDTNDFALNKEETAKIADMIKRFTKKHKIMIHDYINDSSIGINCLAGGNRSFFINEKLEASPCVFMNKFVGIDFDLENNSSNIIDILSHNRFFINARKLGAIYPKCVLLNDPNWSQLLELPEGQGQISPLGLSNPI